LGLKDLDGGLAVADIGHRAFLDTGLAAGDRRGHRFSARRRDIARRLASAEFKSFA
jgi:hypothetical protein